MDVKHLINKIIQTFGTQCDQNFNAEHLFLYDDLYRHSSILDTSHNNRNALHIINKLGLRCLHFCVDGGIIAYGQPTYSFGREIFSKRCDSMLITDRHFLLIELKMEVTEDAKDSTRWDEYSDAMEQIKQFYKYLKLCLPELSDICIGGVVVPYIAIQKAPCFDKKRNSQRNNEKVKFRECTKLKIRHGNELDLNAF